MKICEIYLNSVVVSMVKNNMSITLNGALKTALKEASFRLECSQSEIVRISLYSYLGTSGLIKKQLGDVNESQSKKNY
jgi:hypothetical protein